MYEILASIALRLEAFESRKEIGAVLAGREISAIDEIDRDLNAHGGGAVV
jgi:hypothetical protein